MTRDLLLLLPYVLLLYGVKAAVLLGIAGSFGSLLHLLKDPSRTIPQTAIISGTYVENRPLSGCVKVDAYLTMVPMRTTMGHSCVYQLMLHVLSQRSRRRDLTSYRRYVHPRPLAV